MQIQLFKSNLYYSDLCVRSLLWQALNYRARFCSCHSSNATDYKCFYFATASRDWNVFRCERFDCSQWKQKHNYDLERFSNEKITVCLNTKGMRYTFINGMHFVRHTQKIKEQKAWGIQNGKTTNNGSFFLSFAFAFTWNDSQQKCIRGRQHCWNARNNWRAY